jgi:multiple antibiotic resistance protein
VGLEFAISAFITLFVINNPIGNIPLFVSLTEEFDENAKKRVIYKVCMVMMVILFTFGIFGSYIFEIYGITIPTFKIAGGLLLFSVAWSMMQGERPHAKISDADVKEAREKENIGIVPLGIPMFAGPGTITTVMILISVTTQRDSMFDTLSIFVSIAILTILAYVLLTMATRIFDYMGKSGALVISRIMGLLLGAVAVNFVLSGLFQAIRDAGFA